MGETLSRRDVARIFNVDVATVTRWAKEGAIGFFRNPGHTRVFPECEIFRIIRNEPPSDFVKRNAERDAEIYHEKWARGWRNNGITEPFLANYRDEGDPEGDGDDE